MLENRGKLDVRPTKSPASPPPSVSVSVSLSAPPQSSEPYRTLNDDGSSKWADCASVLPTHTGFFCTPCLASGEDFIEGAPSRDLQNFLGAVSQFVAASPCLSRLSGVAMSTASHTSLGPQFKGHDRLTHVKTTAELSYKFARQIGMSTEEAAVAGIMGLYHDPHAPCSHSFEDVVALLVERARIDGPLHPQVQDEYKHWLFHDLRSVTLFFASEPVREAIRTSQYLKKLHLNDPTIFAAAMADRQEDLLHIARACSVQRDGLKELYDQYRGVNFLVRQLSDRFAYIPEDMRRINLYDEGILHYARANLLPAFLARHTRVVPDPKDTDRSLLAFTDQAFEIVGDANASGIVKRGAPGPLRTLLELRGVARLCSVDAPAGALVKEVLAEELQRFLLSPVGQRSLLFDEAYPDNPRALVNSSDATFKALLSEEARLMLEQGVDRATRPLGAWRLSEIDDRAAHHLQQAGTLEGIKEMLAKGLDLPVSSLFVFLTSDTSMKMDVLRVGKDNDIRPVTVSAYVPPSLRWLSVVVKNSAVAGRDEDALAQLVERFFKDYQVEPGFGLFKMGSAPRNERANLFDPQSLQAKVVAFPPADGNSRSSAG